MKLKQILTKEDRAFGLEWRGILVMIAVALPAGLLFAQYGLAPLARPASFSVACVGLVLFLRWRLRRLWWFWLAMSIMAALHVVVVVTVHWSVQWIPAAVLAPLGTLDVYAMLLVLAAIERSKAKSGLT